MPIFVYFLVRIFTYLSYMYYFYNVLNICAAAHNPRIHDVNCIMQIEDLPCELYEALCGRVDHTA